MKNNLFRKLRNILNEIWRDFKTPASLKTENRNCCSFTAFYPEGDLRPELIGVIHQHNKNINLKNNQS